MTSLKRSHKESATLLISGHFNVIGILAITRAKIGKSVKVAGNTFGKCEKNGFEYDIVHYYHVLKGKEYHSGRKK